MLHVWVVALPLTNVLLVGCLLAAVADHQLAPGTPGAASAADGCGGSASGSVADEGGEALRREWEALLEAAARCKDATQQPQMLTR